MGFGDFVDDVLDDINPLHWINKLNDAIGHSTADILEFLGITDPAVDPDGIRAIATTWKNLADALGAANFSAGQAVLGTGLEGEVGTAFADRAGQVRSDAGRVEDALNSGHDELAKLADQSHELISQVGVLAAQIAEFEVAGLALTVLTGPLSDAAAALASGSRAQRIVAIFGEVEAMAVRVGKVIEDLCAEIGGLARILKALKSVTKMAATGVGTTIAWDALFDPSRLTDRGTLSDDTESGAFLGIGFGVAGKGFMALLHGMGPLGPKFALAADGKPLDSLNDLKGLLGSKFDDMLGVMQARLGNASWPVKPGVPGPAAGKTLQGPHVRHTVTGAKNGEVKELNSVILRGNEQDVLNDIAGIADGRAAWDQDNQRYKINGRTYAVHDNGTVYPIEGPGIAQLDRNEYAALVELVKTGGDPSKSGELTHNPRFLNNPQAVAKAQTIYNGTYR